MSMLLKSIEKKINIDKEVIGVLPKTGIKQLRSIKKKVENLIEKYDKINNSVVKEMNKRYDSIITIKENSEIESVKKQIIELDNLGISSNVPSSFEKMGLDKIVYNLNGYYKKDLKTINKEIIKCIKKFKEVGVPITKKDFNISEYVTEYMNVLFEEASKGDLESERIKSTFDKVYWKCSDIIPHIIVNIRQFFGIHEEEIDMYYKNRTEKVLASLNLTYEEVYNKKQELVKKMNSLISLDGKNILDSFLNNTYNVSDYKTDNYEKIYEKIISKPVSELLPKEKKDMDSNVENLHYNLIEYYNYLEFKFLIDEILKLREEKRAEIKKEEEEKKNKSKDKKNKNKNKSEYETVKEEIKQLNEEIEKLNLSGKSENTKFSLFKKKQQKDIDSNNDEKILERNKKIMQVKELYAKFDNCRLKESVIQNIGDTTTLLEVLRIASYYYGFLARCIIKKFPTIVENEIHDMIARIKKFVRLNYFSVINHIIIAEKKDISIVIKDKYKLFGMTLTKDNFSEANLEELMKDIQIIKVYNDIIKSNILIDDVRYIINAKEILKR